MKVITDSREPKWVQQLTFGGAEVAVTALEAGDVLVECDDGALVLVERKEPSDLLGSLADGRLLHQAARMRERTPWCFLVITGLLQCTRDSKVAVGGRATGWSWDAVQGVLLTVQQAGVGVVVCCGDDDFEATVMRLARRDRSGEVTLAPVVRAEDLTPAEIILSSLPGVGLERARSLLGAFNGSPAKALAWMTCSAKRNETEVAGVGLVTRRRVHQALGLGDREELLIGTPENA